MVKDPDGEDRTAWGPRVLAPLAFFAAVTVLVLLVQSSLGADSNATTTNPPSTPNATLSVATGTTTIGNPGKRKNYRIKEGDTLEAIAERYDTTVEALIELNPNIEANNLEPGTRIRIQ
jgi:LysM repeat protein